MKRVLAQRVRGAGAQRVGFLVDQSYLDARDDASRVANPAQIAEVRGAIGA